MKKREVIYFTVFFTLVVCLVFWEIVSLKKTLIKCDYLQQFYPWSYMYSEGLKKFHLTFWVKEVSCGFPLFAEGQIGQLYPLNILFFFLLPFKWAYNYSFLFHFILAGVFTYVFARKKGADEWGGALAAVLLCFGSAYAGCFLNTSALKALAWFPLCLLLYDEYLMRKERWFIFLIGFVGGMQLLCGSAQMAFYSFTCYFFYFLYGSIMKKERPADFFVNFALISVIALFIASPQIAETFALSAHSNRFNGDLDFSLWNSFPPFTFIGILLPYTVIRVSEGNVIYIGVLSIFFAITAFYLTGREKALRPLVLMLAVSLFVALGGFNPLYVGLLKVTKFYMFRAPSRFIYFGIFSLAILSGRGFTFFTREPEKTPSIVYKLFFILVLAAFSLFLAANAVFARFGPRLIEMAKAYVEKNIYGRPFHRHNLDWYMKKVDDLFEVAKNSFSLKDYYVFTTFILIAAAVFFVFFMGKALKKGNRSFVKIVLLVFISLELVFFSFFSKGIWRESAGFDYFYPYESKIFKIAKEDKSIFRISPFQDIYYLPYWVKPSANAFYGIDSVAIYSPLVNKDYFDLTKNVSLVDDAVGMARLKPFDLYERIELLRVLNAKYVISSYFLNDPSLKLVVKEGWIKVYEVVGHHPRLFFSKNLDNPVEAKADVKLDEYSSGCAKLRIDNESGGFLLFSEKNYPGWEAYADGRKTEILRYAKILQAVKLEPGKHAVIFRYRPVWFNRFMPVSLVTVVITLIAIMVGVMAKARKPV